MLRPGVAVGGAREPFAAALFFVGDLVPALRIIDEQIAARCRQR